MCRAEDVVCRRFRPIRWFPFGEVALSLKSLLFFLVGWCAIVVPVFGQPAVDLGVNMLDLADPVPVGGNVTYVTSVTNLGPAVATGVILTHTFAPALQVISISSSQGGCTNGVGNVSCGLGSLDVAGNVTVSVTAKALSPGTITNFAVISATELDSNLANNVAG